jgi:hypothetical protein
VSHTLDHLARPWPDFDGQEHLTHRIDCRPYPGTRRLQALEGVGFTDLTSLEVTDHRVQLVKLQLLQVEITQEISRKGALLLGRFDQPGQHGVGLDVKDPSRGTATQALSQAGQDAYDEVDLGLFAVKHRAVMLQKKAVTRGAVELTPGAATGMAIGPQVVQSWPAAIRTIAVGTKVHRGVRSTGASVRWGYGLRPLRRRWSPFPDLLLTQCTVGLVRQARKRFGLGGTCARELRCHGWGPGLDPVRCKMMKSQMMANRASW